MVSKEIILSYSKAKEAYLNKNVKKANFVRELMELSGLPKASASSVIYHIFPKLLEGSLYKRTLTPAYQNYFLEKISDDFPEHLDNAKAAIAKHNEYLRNIRIAKLFKQEELKDEKQQEFVKSKREEQQKSKEELLNELKQIEDVLSDEEVTFRGRRLKRKNKIISDIKYVRGCKCQLCDEFILKKNGEHYVEAAHIRAKKDKGGESLKNIILLCPNHHKEFDLGNRSEPSFTDTHLTFTLNGKKYRCRWC